MAPTSARMRSCLGRAKGHPCEEPRKRDRDFAIAWAATPNSAGDTLGFVTSQSRPLLLRQRQVLFHGIV